MMKLHHVRATPKPAVPQTLTWKCPFCGKAHFAHVNSAGHESKGRNCKAVVIPILLSQRPDREGNLIGRPHRWWNNGWIEDAERGVLIAEADWPSRRERLRDIVKLL